MANAAYDKRLDALYWAIRCVLYGPTGGLHLGR